MTGPRVLIVLVVLIAILFVVALRIGAKNNKQADPNQKTWVSRMGEKLIPAVDPKTLSAPCIKPGTDIIVLSMFTRTCEVKIPAAAHAWQSFRRLGFDLKAGAVTISYDKLPKEDTKLPPDKSGQDDSLMSRAPILKQLKKDPNTTSLTILKEGGTITVSCLTPMPCQVEVWASTPQPDQSAAP